VSCAAGRVQGLTRRLACSRRFGGYGRWLVPSLFLSLVTYSFYALIAVGVVSGNESLDMQ
jgi:hypothetical protein